MTELVALKSRTGTADENLASDYIYEYISGMEYFMAHPENCGKSALDNDPCGRHVVYAFVEGNSKKTVIMSGHFDVVDEFDYGEAASLAFSPGKELDDLLRKNKMTTEQKADMDSGEWIWGKGTADMKGGLAIHLDILAEFSDRALAGTLAGSILFIGVPDEESYSYGMRFAVKLIAGMKKERGLDYRLLINPEPTDLVDDKQVMFMGTVGKLMPVVVVQGITAHVGHCFDGFSPLNILTGIYNRTAGSLSFVDSYENEATMPPTWLKLRDLKEVYDVSIPLSAAGYFTVLSLDSTPDLIMDKLTKICREVSEKEAVLYEKKYEMYKKLNSFETKSSLGLAPRVYAFSELRKLLDEKRGNTFASFYKELYDDIKGKTEKGELTYPDATIELIRKVLDFANLPGPVTVIAFAPPYYPAVNSNHITGKENFAKKAYDIISETSAEAGREVVSQNFFMGISDNSYAAADSGSDVKAAEIYAEATPLWGDIYELDFDAVAEINVPAIIYGPIGKEYHKWSERVEKDSLLRVVPYVTRRLVEKAWEF